MSESHDHRFRPDADDDPAVPGSRAAEGSSTPEVPEPGRRPLRVGTIVWGLVLISVASLLLAVRLTDVQLDAGLVALGLTIGAGTALIIGGLLSAVGRRG